MVITTNDITQKTYRKLSIQVSLSGLSFCVFDLITHKVIAFNEVAFSDNQVIEEQLWKAFVTFPILTNTYDEIVIIHKNHLNSFVPTSLFNENYLGSYLQYNVKVFESDLFAYDKLSTYEINNVYVPYVNINNFLLDQFQSFEYCNSNTILVKKLLDFSSKLAEKEVFVHLQENHFEIVILKNQELVLFNSFEYQTIEDFIYYILFTFEQLQLNPEIVPLHLLGICNKEDEFFKIAYKYIKNCDLLDVTQQVATLDQTRTTVRKHFILFHS